MEEKDGRIKIINEVLNGIKVMSSLKIQTTCNIPIESHFYF